MKYSLWKKRGIWYAGTYIDGKQKAVSLKTKNKALANERVKSWLPTSIPKKVPTLQEVLNFYLNYTRDRSANTDKLAERCMEYFINWVGGNLPVTKVSRNSMIEFKEWLKPQYKYNSVKIIMGTLKAIFNLAYKNDFILDSFFKNVVIGKSRSKMLYLDSREIKALVMSVADKPLYQGYLLFLLYTGCRAGELQHLKWSDVKSYHIVFNGKSGERQFPVNPEVSRALAQIRQYSCNDIDVLVDSNGKWIGKYTQLGKIVKRYIRKAGLSEEYSTHTLRHTYASHLVRAGIPLYEVSKLLGHTDIRTTQIYAHLDPKLSEVRVNYEI